MPAVIAYTEKTARGLSPRCSYLRSQRKPSMYQAGDMAASTGASGVWVQT